MSSLAAALEAALEAKTMYRDEPRFAENRDAHVAAAAELRYQRWVARGGPEGEAERLRSDLGHSNRPAGEHYDRWLAENKKG